MFRLIALGIKQPPIDVIGIIKSIRACLGVGLKEAKDKYDSLKLNPVPFELAAVASLDTVIVSKISYPIPGYPQVAVAVHGRPLGLASAQELGTIQKLQIDLEGLGLYTMIWDSYVGGNPSILWGPDKTPAIVPMKIKPSAAYKLLAVGMTHPEYLHEVAQFVKKGGYGKFSEAYEVCTRLHAHHIPFEFAASHTLSEPIFGYPHVWLAPNILLLKRKLEGWHVVTKLFHPNGDEILDLQPLYRDLFFSMSVESLQLLEALFEKKSMEAALIEQLVAELMLLRASVSKNI